MTSVPSRLLGLPQVVRPSQRLTFHPIQPQHPHRSPNPASRHQSPGFELETPQREQAGSPLCEPGVEVRWVFWKVLGFSF
jgi:hypothetical protein